VTDEALMKSLRLFLLRERAKGAVGFGLSWVAKSVTPRIDQYHHSDLESNNRSRFTSGVPKKMRGRVQAGLSKLALSGLLFTRRHPEGGIQAYEHCETDKRFFFRISQEDAKRQLSRMKEWN
jgi:hypothetical protein